MTWQPGHVTTKLQCKFKCALHQTLSHLICPLTSSYMHLLNIYGCNHQTTRGGKLQLPARGGTAPESIQDQVDFWQHFNGEEGEFGHKTPLCDPYDDPFGITVNTSSSCLCPLLPAPPPQSPPPPARLRLRLPRPVSGTRRRWAKRFAPPPCFQGFWPHADANGETHKHRRPLRTSFRRLISKRGTKARPAALAAMSPRITWLLRTK